MNLFVKWTELVFPVLFLPIAIVTIPIWVPALLLQYAFKRYERYKQNQFFKKCDRMHKENQPRKALGENYNG